MANRKIADLLNLGASAAEDLASIGIHTEADLERVGVIEAYLQLKARGYQQWSVVGLWAMWGALHNTHWNQIPPDVKEVLRRAVAAQPASPDAKRNGKGKKTGA